MSAVPLKSMELHSFPQQHDCAYLEGNGSLVVKDIWIVFSSEPEIILFEPGQII